MARFPAVEEQNAHPHARRGFGDAQSYVNMERRERQTRLQESHDSGVPLRIYCATTRRRPTCTWGIRFYAQAAAISGSGPRRDVPHRQLHEHGRRPQRQGFGAQAAGLEDCLGRPGPTPTRPFACSTARRPQSVTTTSG